MLTSAQVTILRNAALADPVAVNYINNAQDQLLADWLNTPQPAFMTWRSTLTTDQARAAIMLGISQLDNLTVGKRDSLLWVFSVTTYPVDMTVTTAIDALCGTQNTLKGALQDALRRPTTLAEKLLSSGTGTYASPAVMTYEGLFSAPSASSLR